MVEESKVAVFPEYVMTSCMVSAFAIATLCEVDASGAGSLVGSSPLSALEGVEELIVPFITAEKSFSVYPYRSFALFLIVSGSKVSEDCSTEELSSGFELSSGMELSAGFDSAD